MARKQTEDTPRSVTPWGPLGELEGWSPFGDLFGSRLRRLTDEWPAARAGGPALALDVHESDEAYTVTVEIPGVKKEDLSVEVEDGVLSIRGEKRSEREEKSEKRRYVERSYGSFSRSLSLPRNVSPDKVDARYHDGVLTITLPKAEESKPQPVAVK